MAYVPVQRDAGRIMYEGAMQRARTIGQGVRDITDTLYQREEENKAFGAKLKSLESLLQSHSDKFGLKPDQLKQFLSVDPAESPKERYLRIGGFVEGSLKAAELNKIQLANQKTQQELDQIKRLGEIYSSIGKPPPQTTDTQRKYRRVNQESPSTATAPSAPSSLERGSGEMSLLNSLRRFSTPDQAPQAMVGAEAFEFKPAAAPAPSVEAAMPSPAAVSMPARQAAPSVAAAEETYDVPPPKVPSWFGKSEQSSPFGMDLNLSPEAKAIAARLRQEYEASQPSEDGREPIRTISATQDTAPRKKKSITLDAEGIRAILSNPRILVESFADVAGDPYQQGLRRERLDRMMREQEQLRALEQMMRSKRRGR